MSAISKKGEVKVNVATGDVSLMAPICMCDCVKNVQLYMYAPNTTCSGLPRCIVCPFVLIGSYQIWFINQIQSRFSLTLSTIIGERFSNSLFHFLI